MTWLIRVTHHTEMRADRVVQQVWRLAHLPGHTAASSECGPSGAERGAPPVQGQMGVGPSPAHAGEQGAPSKDQDRPAKDAKGTCASAHAVQL